MFRKTFRSSETHNDSSDDEAITIENSNMEFTMA